MIVANRISCTLKEPSADLLLFRRIREVA